MELAQLFEQAVADSKNLASKPANNILLQLYALYKQATVGDVSADAPDNPFDFAAKAKYNEWLGLKGTSKEQAMQQYADLIQYLKPA